MEFEDEHDEEQEEEDDEDEIVLPPPAIPPSYINNSVIEPPNSVAQHRVTPVTPSPSSETRRSYTVRYRECLKNHAVSLGGHAVDGCGEFMPAGDDGTLDALKCAACSCHRNFHRKETNPSVDTPPPPPPNSAGTMYPQFSAYYRTPAPPSGYLHMSSHPRQLPAAALPSSNTSGGTHSGELGDDMSYPSSSGGGGRDSGGGGGGMMTVSGHGTPRKRHRTKFSQEQKDKMLGFAEKLGWRIQKHDEAAVQQFCAETQVRRQVLKVWMHNNKHTLGKSPKLNLSDNNNNNNNNNNQFTPP